MCIKQVMLLYILKKEESRIHFFSPFWHPTLYFIYYIKRYTFVAGTAEATKHMKNKKKVKIRWKFFFWVLICLNNKCRVVKNKPQRDSSCIKYLLLFYFSFARSVVKYGGSGFIYNCIKRKKKNYFWHLLFLHNSNVCICYNNFYLKSINFNLMLQLRENKQTPNCKL